MKVKNILENKTLLYIIFFIAVTNFFGYLMTNQNEAVIIFLLTGLITSFFSKNMIVISLVAILATNFLAAGNFIQSAPYNIQESFTSNRQVAKPASDEMDEMEATGKKPKLNYAETIEAAYDSLDQIIGSDAIRQMSGDTQRLIHKQQGLIESMKSLQPMISKVGSAMQKIDNTGLQNTISHMGKMVNNLTPKDKDEDKEKYE